MRFPVSHVNAIQLGLPFLFLFISFWFVLGIFMALVSSHTKGQKSGGPRILSFSRFGLAEVVRDNFTRFRAPAGAQYVGRPLHWPKDGDHLGEEFQNKSNVAQH